MHIEQEADFKAYFTYSNYTESPIQVSIGESIEEYKGETLYNSSEAFITREICYNQNLLQDFLPKFSINYPNFWYCIEIPTKELDKTYSGGKPGDIDLIFGNFEDDNKTLNFNNLFAIQVKVRKVREDNELQYFSSGEGTKQAYGTAKLGFDRTLLLHILVREPKPSVAGDSPLWNVFDNSDFFHHSRRMIGPMKDKLNKELYGYGWLGWGQSSNRNWQLSGTLKFEVYTAPPFQPWKHQVEIELKRIKLIENLKELSKNKEIKNLPHCLFDK